ncbi:MAG: M17 family peptidase N-terminal domain-containing protein, partial [Isosphaeraceae bacterium]
MIIQVLRQPLADIQSPWLVLLLLEEQGELAVEVRDTALGDLLSRLIVQKEITGSAGELTVVHGPAGFAAGSVLIVGLGPTSKFDAGAAYAAGFALAKRLAGKPRESVALALPDAVDRSVAGWISALVAGVVAGTRGPGLRKTEPNRHPFETLNIIIGPGATEDLAHQIEEQVRRGEIVGQAINLARDLANTPPSEKCPSRLAEQVRTVASDAGIAVQIWDETRIRQERFGGLLGVAAGSENPPSFVILD